MQEPNWETVREEELWKYVGWHLAKAGIDSILVGGAVVSVYSEGAYESGDLDFVTYEKTFAELSKVLESIGLYRHGMSFVHPRCRHLFVQIVSGPLGIGDDLSIKPDAVVVEGRKLKIYSPTDCIRDRLAGYIFFKARDCFDQAVLVAKSQAFDAKKVERWLTQEGYPEVYQEFIEKLKSK